MAEGSGNRRKKIRVQKWWALLYLLLLYCFLTVASVVQVDTSTGFSALRAMIKDLCGEVTVLNKVCHNLDLLRG